MTLEEQITKREREIRDVRGLLREAVERLCYDTFPGEQDSCEWAHMINDSRNLGARLP